MFYSQSVDNIKLIVLTLDGGLLDLNRLRYNYFKRTCELYNRSITKEQFSFMLGNMKTMYDRSPIQEFISNEEFSKNVEKDLFEYAKLKQNLKREGVDELIQYCKQKNIKIAVYTTHKSKRAIQYLQLAGLYNKIDFLIGGDSQLKPLPKKDVLLVICQQMNIAPKHTLVVANFESMVEAAINVYANVIYMPDLAPANDTLKSCVYRVVKNYLEVMNVFLFSKYDNIEMFSPILGMNGNMDRDTLYLTKNKLIKKYKDDDQLIALVNKTYEYFLDLLYKQEISKKLSDRQKIMFSFEDEKPDDKESLDNDLNQSINKKNISEKFTENIDNKQETKQYSLNNNHDEDEINDDFHAISGATSYDIQRMNELMDIINGNLKDNSDEEEIVEDVNDDETKENQAFYTIINIVYSFLLSIISVLIGLVCGLFFKDFLSGTSMCAKLINSVFHVYMSIINGLYGVIFDGLHSIISFIPSYMQFIYKNKMLSSMASLSLLAVVFNFICILILRKMINYFVESKNAD